MIQTQNLTKVYNGKRAVDALNLEVAKGEIFGFLGPNGAGKSTTILMLVGMIEPTEGSCHINGIEVATNPIQVKEIVGYLPEDVGFYGNMTAEQNLDYFARFYRMDAGERKKRIRELLELVHLDGVTQKAGEYSRGMKQRLGLAQALLNDPLVLFLDEPTANLDPEAIAEYRDLVHRLSREGKTIFVSSHILSEVTQVCTTIGILRKGRLIAQGTLEEVKTALDRSGTESVKIYVETAGPIPEIAHADILNAEYDGHWAVIESRSDIRDAVAASLHESGARIRELKRVRPSLEEVFLSVYRGES
ncbi:MAG: ABC transporter ATP-binding protein [Methanomicrobiales archaeon]|nr:ABC transporter ATP-binding protein [Methanomicrobiales archaeon]MDI6876255.1 ABC transporter ATP-binding protein [Methanomicrobiales archaeon]